MTVSAGRYRIPNGALLKHDEIISREFVLFPSYALHVYR